MAKNNLDRQFGTKDSWRYRSITTPGHSFSFIQFLAETIILQRYGLNTPPYFWYKSTKQYKMRDDFIKIQNQIAAMIKRKNHITACELLCIICEKFPPLGTRRIAQVEQAASQCSSKPLIELHVDNDVAQNITAIAQWAGENDG